MIELSEIEQNLKQEVKDESKSASGFFTSNTSSIEEIRKKLASIRNISLFRKIIKELEKWNYQSEVAKRLKIKKQLCWYYVKKAEKLGLIRKEYRTSIAVYEVLPIWKEVEKIILELLKSKNTTLRVKSVRTHNLAVKFPILQDNPGAKFEREVKVNGWVKRLDFVTSPIRMTVEKTPRNVILYFHEFSVDPADFLTYMFRYVLKGVLLAYEHLRKKGIKINIWEGEVIREHISNEIPSLNSLIPKTRTVEVKLGRKARSIYPFDEEGRVWIDRSGGNVEVETNDLLYEEKLLLIPERVDEIPYLRREVEEVKKEIQEINSKLSKIEAVVENTWRRNNGSNRISESNSQSNIESNSAESK